MFLISSFVVLSLVFLVEIVIFWVLLFRIYFDFVRVCCCFVSFGNFGILGFVCVCGKLRVLGLVVVWIGTGRGF